MTARPKTVLVVDDDDDLRASVSIILEDEGWIVREARHGAEALELLQEFQPSVMLLDWRMPVMDGGQVLERLDPDTSRPRVVLVTANAQVEELAAKHRLRFRLGKPFAVEDLLATLRQAHAA